MHSGPRTELRGGPPILKSKVWFGQKVSHLIQCYGRRRNEGCSSKDFNIERGWKLSEITLVTITAVLSGERDAVGNKYVESLNKRDGSEIITKGM